MGEQSIDDYLESVTDAGIRSVLGRLRAVIAAAAPEAEESWSYGMPSFRHRGRPLVGFQAAARHAGFYPMSPALIEVHAAELIGFATSKGTIRFTPERPIPDALVMTIVRERMAEIDRKRGAATTDPG